MFAFSEETVYQSLSETWARGIAQLPVFWQTMTHTPLPRLGLVIRAGCSAQFEVQIAPGSYELVLVAGAALSQISPDGMDFTVSVGEDRVLSHHIAAFDPSEPWYEFRLPIQVPAEVRRLTVSCTPGPEGNPAGDWLGLYELVIAPEREMSIERARTFHRFRASNELSVCCHTYAQPMYKQARPLTSMAHDPEALSNLIVDQLLGLPLPNFSHLLLRRLAMKRPLRLLSLASGAARVEGTITYRVSPALLDITLTDLNQQLLDEARESLLPHRVKTLVTDLNHLELPVGEYDIIICVSALHHLVELERAIPAIAQALAPDGEFWSIGEYVGRNGARLWPEPYEEANRFFRALPEKYRVNRCFGRVDTDLPNFDCSVLSFESIRSEELEPILLKHFRPEWMDKRSTITWRLFDATYGPNYDVTTEVDCALVQKAAELDVSLMNRGVPPVSMNGVFRPRTAV